MKKVLIIFLLIILAAAVLPAAADVIWTPMDEYLSNCTYTDEMAFIVADPNGWVPVLDLPPDGKQIGILPNGTEIVTFTFCGPEGEQWSWLKERRLPGKDSFILNQEGFIPSGSLVPAYDTETFVSQHQEEILPFDGEYDFCGSVPFPIMKYPNAGVRIYEMDADHLKGCTTGPDIKEKYHVDRIYTDSEGNRWVTFDLPWGKSFEYGWVNIGPAE